MVSYYVQLSLIFSLFVFSSESPLDVGISVSEGDGLEKIELKFSSILRPPVNSLPSTTHRQAITRHHRISRTTPRYQVSSDRGGYQVYDERPTSETRLLHLDFGIILPWVLPLPQPTLPRTPLPRSNIGLFATIQCTNTSFPEGVFCDLRPLIPKELNDVITEVSYVLLRFPHPFLEGTNCTALLQPRNANNYEDKDDEEKENEDGRKKKDTIEDSNEASKNGTNEAKMIYEDESKGDAHIRKDNGDESENEEDSSENEEEDEDDEELEERDSKDRKKREGSNRRKIKNPLHIFYDRSSCKPKVSKIVTPLVNMEEVTHIEINFYGNELIYLVELVKNTHNKYSSSNGETDSFPLLFTVENFNYASPVTGGGEEADCRWDGNRCRP